MCVLRCFALVRARVRLHSSRDAKREDRERKVKKGAMEERRRKNSLFHFVALHSSFFRPASFSFFFLPNQNKHRPPLFKMPPKRKAASSPSDMTVKQLQAALKKAKVPYDVKARKAELVELLSTAQAAKVRRESDGLFNLVFLLRRITHLLSLFVASGNKLSSVVLGSETNENA